MAVGNVTLGQKVVVERQQLGELLRVLQKRGYKLVGPTRRDGAIVYDEIAGVADLPAGSVGQAGR